MNQNAGTTNISIARHTPMRIKPYLPKKAINTSGLCWSAKFTADKEQRYQQLETVHLSKEQSKTATELAYAEVISYNKKNLERKLQNESRQPNKQQSKTKREEEI